MNPQPSPIALISVTDKTGVTEFARGLLALNFQLLSTGGTAKLLREAKLPVTEVAEFTGSPEVLSGRVKTLHPTIHGGILADRHNSHHQRDLAAMNWRGIDLVVVNLYNFANEARDKGLQIDQAVEFIDIGGPAMLRAAAKNHRNCLPIIDPHDYSEVLNRLKAGDIDDAFRRGLAAKVFETTSAYDRMIAASFATALGSQLESSEASPLPQLVQTTLEKQKSLRYGENSHQKAAFYTDSSHPPRGLAAAEFLHGKDLSYNNYVDLDAAASIVAELAPMPAVTIVKHTNPCGSAAGVDGSLKDLFTKALAADPKSAFGGIVACNTPIDEPAAIVMSEIFLECIIAPDFSPDALSILKNKKNLRLLKSNAVLESGKPSPSSTTWRSINGGILVQTADSVPEISTRWTCASKTKPDGATLAQLQFGMSVCKHVKSNAIVLSSNFQTIGVGAGQMSRIDSTKFAISKARELGHTVRGSVLASDAFFPFRDCIDEAAKAGIIAIAQPGGSLRDQESIDAANDHGIVLMLTGLRHFKH